MSLDRAEGGVKRILIVDDDEPTRRLIATLMVRDGHHASIAENGNVALQMLAENAYDAVILDLMMPQVNGHMVVEHLSRQATRPPVIVCTAAGPSFTREINRDVVHTVIRKPFEIDVMRKAVAEVLSAK